MEDVSIEDITRHSLKTERYSVSRVSEEPNNWVLAVRKLRGNWILVLGLVFLLLPVLAAIFAPYIAPDDPAKVSLQDRLLPPMWDEGGSAAHPFGTDALGRDTLSRLVYGARISLLVGVLSVLLSGTIGVTLGIIAGYFGGKIEAAIMRLVDIQLAVPYIALAMAMVAIVGPGLRNVIITLGILGWVLYARIVRAETLSIKQREYVMAARSLGASNLHILVRHILPNVIPHVLVIATFAVATMITLEAALSFLGLGVQSPTSTWGVMLSDARQYIRFDYWQPTFPGLAIMVTLIGVNIVGDWLRDMWDPTMRGRE